MKIRLFIILLSVCAFSIGCGATTRPSTEEEKAKSQEQMKADMQSMMQSIPKDPSQTKPAGGATAPATP